MDLIILCTVACQEKCRNMSKHTLPMYCTTVHFWDSKNTLYSSRILEFLQAFSVYSEAWKKMSISHDHSTSYFYFGFRSQETPIDGQPPALPPKQFKKNSWNQIHHSHSQQELDNHINETFDVPASPEKSTVSFWI